MSIREALRHPFWWLRSKAHASSWSPIAREFGLHWDSRRGRMSGFIGDDFVAAWTGHSHVEVTAALWPPLDLVLRRRSSLQASWTNNLYLEHLVSGSSEPRRVKELIQPIRQELLNHGFHLQLRNDYVTLWKRGFVPSRSLGTMIRTILRIVAAIDRTRPNVSHVPHARALLREWEKPASTRGMSRNVTPLGYHGTQRNIALLFFLQRRGADAWSLKTFAGFRAPLGIGFSARSRNTELARPWGFEPLSVGDPRFDRLFETGAFESHYVRQALSAAARERLCVLAEKEMHVVVHDRGVLVESRLLGSASLDALLDELCTIAELVDFTLPPRGAYR